MRWKTALLVMLVMAGLALLVNRESPIGAGLSRTIAKDAGGTPVVEWATLRGLDDHTGKSSSEVAAIDGKPVKVPGYIVPLDDDTREITEFLLVPYMGACVHTPPPPPNQMIYVKMLKGEKAAFGLNDAVWVEGAIFVGRRSSPYGPTFYAMTAKSVAAYQ
jgi:hypothetical protein